MKKEKIHLTVREFQRILLNLGQVCNVMCEDKFEINVHHNKDMLTFQSVIDENEEFGWKCVSHIIVIL